MCCYKRTLLHTVAEQQSVIRKSSQTLVSGRRPDKRGKPPHTILPAEQNTRSCWHTEGASHSTVCVSIGEALDVWGRESCTFNYLTVFLFGGLRGCQWESLNLNFVCHSVSLHVRVCVYKSVDMCVCEVSLPKLNNSRSSCSCASVTMSGGPDGYNEQLWPGCRLKKTQRGPPAAAGETEEEKRVTEISQSGNFLMVQIWKLIYYAVSLNYLQRKIQKYSQVNYCIRKVFFSHGLVIISCYSPHTMGLSAYWTQAHWVCSFF